MPWDAKNDIFSGLAIFTGRSNCSDLAGTHIGQSTYRICAGGRSSLEDALSWRLSARLAKGTVQKMTLGLFHDAYTTDASIIDSIEHDLEVVKERDPACDGFLSPFLYFKGFQALSAFRVAHWLWQQDRRDLALYLQSLISVVYGVDIHPTAVIGKGILLDHATGFVAGETTVIEDNVSILHEVTLGGTEEGGTGT